MLHPEGVCMALLAMLGLSFSFSMVGRSIQRRSSLGMAASAQTEEWFAHAIQARQYHDAFRDISIAAAEALQEIPKPGARDEAWRYNDLSLLFAHRYTFPKAHLVTLNGLQQYIREDCKEACLVFVDGEYSPGLSRTSALPEGITATNFRSLALDQRVKFAERFLCEIAEVDELSRNSYGTPPFALLNLANLQDCCVLVAHKGQTPEQAVQVLHVSTSDMIGPSCSHPRVMYVGEEGSKLKLIQSFVGKGLEGVPSLTNAFMNIHLEKEATLQHISIQEETPEGRHLNTVSVSVGESAQYQWTGVQLGSKFSRVNIFVDLNASGANASIHGLCISSQQEHDVHTRISHLAPSCLSKQLQHNILGEKAEVIFKGRICVPQVAQQTDSSQSCRSIMLHDNAHVVALPTLEITADQVTCSHGAVVSDIDENALFYLRSKGLERSQARVILIDAFVKQALDRVDDKSTLDRIFDKVRAVMPAEDREMGSTAFLSM